jgi:NAD(P)-dependent dehydrogenase (short-subunit alcohol dehydrogenase family)
MGLATAKAFAVSGAAVVLVDWNEKSVRAAADEFVAQGHKALAVACDVSVESRIQMSERGSCFPDHGLDLRLGNHHVRRVLN